MDEDLNIWIKISQQIGELNSSVKGVLEKLTNHEQRLTSLEQNKTGIKDTVIEWLVKGLISSIMVIGSLTGAGALIKQVWGGG